MSLPSSLSAALPVDTLPEQSATARARGFYNPHNTFCALWASAVETYLRGEHPDLTLGQIRQLPMMQGVFQHLRDLEKGKRQAAPEPSAKTEVDPVDQLALMSQDFLDLGMTIMLFSTVGNALYEKFIEYLDDVNNNSVHPVRDYSTDDLIGFALCTIVYVGLTGANLNNTENEFVQYMIDTLDISAENKQKIRNFWDNMTPNTAYSFQYRDVSDSRYSHYGTIPWTVPNNAQIILLGDWGTSLDDAHQLLYSIWKTAYQTNASRPIVFIHLGDIYYTGLPAECDQNFNQVFLTIGQQLRNEFGSGFDPHPPIFTIPGNHEYYSYGYGYFQLLDTLNRNNASIPASQIIQTCSFFCLRSEDNNWQFLGMDTGQDDYNGITAAMAGITDTIGGWLTSHLPSWGWLDWVENMTNTFVQDIVGPFAPQLKESELHWHQTRMSEFERNGGKTILFSHHQLFSRNAEINHADPKYLNASLLQNFKDQFKDHVAAWFWGHEHSYAVYQDGIFGLNKGRLLGSSSYEATQENDDPYKNNYPMVPYADNMTPLPIGQNGDGLYNHAAAIIHLNGDHLTVAYYQFPAWNNVDAEPTLPDVPLTAFMTERIDSNFRFLLPTWIGNQPISQDHVVTDHNPALTSWDQTLYLVYTDSSGNLSMAKANLTDYRPTSKNDAPAWDNLGAFQIDSSPLPSSHSPAAVAVNGKVYCFYINSNNHIKVVSYNTSNGNVSDLGSMHDSSNNSLVTGDSGLAVVFFEGVIYVVYRQSGSANNLRWAYFNPSTHATTDLGAMKDSNNSQVESELIPALAASPYRMVMVLQQSGSSTDLQWAESSGGSWTLHGDINSLKTNQGTDTPNSSIGFALNFYNNRWYLVYTDTSDSNNYMRLCMMNDADNAWKGNDQITIYKNDNGNKSYPQTSQAPALGITAGGGMLCYRGNTHDEIFWAYF